jgi:hypothetical protein
MSYPSLKSAAVGPSVKSHPALADVDRMTQEVQLPTPLRLRALELSRGANLHGLAIPELCDLAHSRSESIQRLLHLPSKLSENAAKLKTTSYFFPIPTIPVFSDPIT